jgi:putrescine aminotransferase
MTDAAKINHLWTHKTQNHPTLPDEELVIDHAEGVWVWTEKGHKLMDGFAGLAVVNVGHGRREIAEAIAEQTVRLAYYPTTRQFSNRPAAELATKLADLTPGDLDYTMFAVSGSEANERALQMARHYWLATGHPDKYKVVSLEGGYHGATGATLSICGIPDLVKAYGPSQTPGSIKVKPPYPFRDRGTGTDEALVERRAGELRDAILQAGPETVSAVIMEPVISSGGFIMPPIGWLKAVRKICDDLEVLMIADEVITGFGRTGRWFGVEHDGVVPDIMSVAKGITSGYIPLSAAIARRKLADAFPEDAVQENVHPNTYAAHPVACAAGLANLQIMQKDNLVENAAVMGTAAAGRPAKRRRDLPDHRRGAGPRPDGLRRVRRARRLRQAARQEPRGPARSARLGPRRDRLRPQSCPSPGPAPLHHGRGGRSARRNGRR